MKLDLDLRDILDSLSEEDVPLMGVADAGTPLGVPAEFTPRALIPDAMSVIVFATPIPRGIVHAHSHALDLYWRFCALTYRTLDEVAHRLCRRLEESGHVASPAYGCFPQKLRGERYHGLLPLVPLAEAAGIGRVGRSGLLVHPEHGPRLLLAGVVTSARFAACERLEFDPCPQGCSECQRACRAGAIDATGRVNHDLCLRAANRNPAFWHFLKDEATRDKFPIDTLLNTVGVDDHASYECMACLRECPVGR